MEEKIEAKLKELQELYEYYLSDLIKFSSDSEENEYLTRRLIEVKSNINLLKELKER